jgi:O-antigen/teichoic acid export membrane protein
MANSFRYHFFTILGGNVISQLIPFIIAPFLTRIYSKTDFSVLASWLSIVGLFGIIACGRLDIAVPLPNRNKEALSIFTTGFMLTILVTILSVPIVFFAESISNWYGVENLKYLIWLIPIGILSYGMLNLFSNWALRKRKYQSISSGKIVQSIINNFGAVILGYLMFGIYGMIISWIISQFINTFIITSIKEIKFIAKKGDFSIFNFKDILKRYQDFPLYNSMHAFLDILATQFILFLIIQKYFSAGELGLFFVMHRYVRAPIGLVSSSVSQLFYVEATKAIQRKESAIKMVYKTIKTVLFFAIPFTLTLVFFAPQIFELYLGKDWKEAGEYAQILAPVFFLMFISSPISVTPLMFNKQKKAFVFTLIGYSFSIGSLIFGFLLGFDFKQTLILYGIVFSLFYFFLIFWYIYLHKQ